MATSLPEPAEPTDLDWASPGASSPILEHLLREPRGVPARLVDRLEADLSARDRSGWLPSGAPAWIGALLLLGFVPGRFFGTVLALALLASSLRRPRKPGLVVFETPDLVVGWRNAAGSRLDYASEPPWQAVCLDMSRRVLLSETWSSPLGSPLPWNRRKRTATVPVDRIRELVLMPRSSRSLPSPLGLGRRSPTEPFVLAAIGPFEGSGLRVSLALLGRQMYPALADRNLPEGSEVLGLCEDVSAATLLGLGRRLATRLRVDLVDLCGNAPRRTGPEDLATQGRRHLSEVLGIAHPDLDSAARPSPPIVAGLPLLFARNRSFRNLDRLLAWAVPIGFLSTCLALAAMVVPRLAPGATGLLPALLVATLAGLTLRSILGNARAELRARIDAGRIVFEERWGEHLLGSLEIEAPRLLQMIEGQGQLRLVLAERELLIPVGDPLALRRSLESELLGDLGLVSPGGLFRDLYWFAGEAGTDSGQKKPAPGRLRLRWKGRRVELSARRERPIPGLGGIDPVLALPGEEGVISSLVLHGTRLAGGRSFRIRLGTAGPDPDPTQGFTLDPGVTLLTPEGESVGDPPAWASDLPSDDLRRLASDLPGGLIDVNPIRAALFHPGLSIPDRAVRIGLSVLDRLLAGTVPEPGLEPSQDPIRVEALRPGTARCGFCADEVPEIEAVPCPRCEAPHHRECWDQNGGCTVFGCTSASPDPGKGALTGPAGGA